MSCCAPVHSLSRRCRCSCSIALLPLALGLPVLPQMLSSLIPPRLNCGRVGHCDDVDTSFRLSSSSRYAPAAASADIPTQEDDQNNRNRRRGQVKHQCVPRGMESAENGQEALNTEHDPRLPHPMRTRYPQLSFLAVDQRLRTVPTLPRLRTEPPRLHALGFDTRAPPVI